MWFIFWQLMIFISPRQTIFTVKFRSRNSLGVVQFPSIRQNVGDAMFVWNCSEALSDNMLDFAKAALTCAAKSGDHLHSDHAQPWELPEDSFAALLQDVFYCSRSSV